MWFPEFSAWAEVSSELCVGLNLWTLLPWLYLQYTAHSILSLLCVSVCVCGPGMWPFPWFHSSAVRMCLSEQEFGIAFLKQTRGKREKRGGTGQRAFSKGLGMVSGLDEGWFLHRWPWNSSFVCWVCVVCVCVSTAVSTGLPDDSSTDGFIGFTLNEGKRRRHLLWFGLTGTP